MTRRFTTSLTIAALAAVLAACQVTVTGPTWPPTFVATVEAQDTSDPSVQEDGTLSPGSTRYFELDVDVVRDHVYAEVGGSNDLRISLFSTGGTRLAVSESATYFGGSIAAIGASAAGLAPSSLSVAFPCLGPCVAVESTASTYVVAVTNTSGSSANFELFAYTFDATDTNEANDSAAAATVLSGADTYEGAIEHLGDVDYFEYQATAGGDFFVVFQPFDQSLGLTLEILDCPTCEVLDGTSGATVEGLLDGDVLRVRSEAGRAGPSATSGYSLQVTSNPPVSSVSTR